MNKKKEYQRKELVGYEITNFDLDKLVSVILTVCSSVLFFGYCYFRYSMQQMYDVVADVDNYNKFVPYCKKSTVFNRKPNSAQAQIVVGFPPLYERYTSNLTLQMPNLIKSECYDGRLFNYLQNYWGFSPGLKDVPESCVIDFRVTFEFKSVLHSHLSHLFFDAIVQQMEMAFVREAERRYGQARIKALLLSLQKS